MSQVNEAAENSLHGLNIAVYQGVIEDLSLNEDDGSVSGVFIRRKRLDTDATSVCTADEGLAPIAATVEIISESEAKEFVSCKTILFCNNPSCCDIDLFSAIKDCGLVFDGGVVVDKVSVQYLRSDRFRLICICCSRLERSTRIFMLLGPLRNIRGVSGALRSTTGYIYYLMSTY